jgi:hypothetical protein
LRHTRTSFVLRGQSEICVEGAVRQGGFSRQLSDQVTDG